MARREPCGRSAINSAGMSVRDYFVASIAIASAQRFMAIPMRRRHADPRRERGIPAAAPERSRNARRAAREPPGGDVDAVAARLTPPSGGRGRGITSPRNQIRGHSCVTSRVRSTAPAGVPRLCARDRGSSPLSLASPRRSDAIPTPASILGFEPGADRHLPSWKQIVDYFTALDKASPRVSVRTLGKTTLGRPFIVAFISDSSTLANLEHYRQIQRKLMDPRLQAAGERQKLIDEGKNVILVTSAIHSTESGGFTTPIVLADRLARGAGSRGARRFSPTRSSCSCRRRIPTASTSSATTIASTLGTPAEGRDPPDLYHKYAGHDDNRDWYAFTQVETRYTVDSLYTPWDPQIVNDIHQQGRTRDASSFRRTWIRSSRTSIRFSPRRRTGSACRSCGA